MTPRESFMENVNLFVEELVPPDRATVRLPATFSKSSLSYSLKKSHWVEFPYELHSIEEFQLRGCDN